jgi:predicted DNA-binding protein
LVKTTIDIPDETWKRFSITVMEEKGGRKKNDIITELIEEYCTEHNGVVCRNCFATIDLTEIAKEGGTKPIPFWEAMMRDKSEGRAFKATCRQCKKELTYLMSEVRPIRRAPQ